jgi:hypothetical protein
VRAPNPYGGDGAGQRIAAILARVRGDGPAPTKLIRY